MVVGGGGDELAIVFVGNVLEWNFMLFERIVS